MSVENHADISYLLKEQLSVGVALLEARPLANVDSFLPSTCKNFYLSFLLFSVELLKLSIGVTGMSVGTCFTRSEGVLGRLTFLWCGLTARSRKNFLVCHGENVHGYFTEMMNCYLLCRGDMRLDWTVSLKVL